MAKHWLITKMSGGTEQIVSYGDGDTYNYNFPSYSSDTTYKIYTRDESGITGTIDNYVVKKTSQYICNHILVRKNDVGSITSNTGCTFFFQPYSTGSTVIAGVKNYAYEYEATIEYDTSSGNNWLSVSAGTLVRDVFPIYVNILNDNMVINSKMRTATITLSFSCKDCDKKIKIVQFGTAETCENTYLIDYNSIEYSGTTNSLIGFVGYGAMNSFNVAGNSPWCTITKQFDASTSASSRDYGAVYLSASQNDGTPRQMVYTASTRQGVCDYIEVRQKSNGDCECEDANLPSFVEFPAQGGNVAVARIAASCTVSTVSKPSWITNIYNNNGEITMVCDENNSSSTLTGTVTVRINSVPCSSYPITVRQPSTCNCNSMMITVNSLTFDHTGGTSSIGGILTSCSSILTTSAIPDWLTKSIGGGGTISFTASANKAYAERTASIDFYVGNKCGTVNITQYGTGCTCSSLSVSASSVTAPSALEYDYNIGLITENCDFDIIECPSWIETWTTSRGDGYKTVGITILEHTDFAARSGVLRLSAMADDTDACESYRVEVHQPAASCSCQALNIYFHDVAFNRNGQPQSVDTNKVGNIIPSCKNTLTAYISQPWINYIINDQTGQIIITVGTSSEIRQGYIDFSINNDVCTRVNVLQTY